MVHHENRTTAPVPRRSLFGRELLNEFDNGGDNDGGEFEFLTTIKNTINRDEWFQLWNDDHDDWETQRLSEARMVVFRLHDDESIQRAVNRHYRQQDVGSDDSVVVPIENNNRRRHLHGDGRGHYLNSVVLKDSSPPPLEQFVFQDSDYYSLVARDDEDDVVVDSYETHLNWATHDNPDGVPIVHRPMDQGICGACWAFAATGTVEASASRRVAFQAYTTAATKAMNGGGRGGSEGRRKVAHRNRYLRRRHGKQHGKAKRKTDEIISMDLDDEEDTATHHTRAVQIAQKAEHEAIKLANLSVQELVDCDTWADQGCTGGNPLLAFYFIKRYGLTSQKVYPYVGLEDSCRVNRVLKSIATVQSWGILTSNHEDNMANVLLNIGPVAVAVNGADPAFLAYSGGIFDSPDCSQLPNHALLIVGYGEETNTEGETVKYWIARNSWGSGWGENGYVRMKRGSGKKGEEGVCGIARSPSVALGGVLLPESGISHILKEINSQVMMDQQPGLKTSFVNSYCETIGWEHDTICTRVEGFVQSHHVVIFCCVSFLVGAMVAFPLTKDCRYRRRRRQRLQRQAEEAARRSSMEDARSTSDETTLLVPREQNVDTYGASAERS